MHVIPAVSVAVAVADTSAAIDAPATTTARQAPRCCVGSTGSLMGVSNVAVAQLEQLAKPARINSNTLVTMHGLGFASRLVFLHKDTNPGSPSCPCPPWIEAANRLPSLQYMHQGVLLQPHLV